MQHDAALSLTVLSVAYPFAPVAPDAAGGAEQVLGQLDAALVAAGHRSIVVANAASKICGTLIPTDTLPGPITHVQRHSAWAEHRRNLLRALAAYHADVVHMHGIDFHHYLPLPGPAPVLVTLHLPPSWYGAEAFELRRGVHLHCVSSARAVRTRTRGPPAAPGCRRAGPRPARHAGSSPGRSGPASGQNGACGSGTPGRAPARRFRFREQVAPRLDRERRFIGLLAFRRKRRLLAAARCVLLPTLAPETSSLVAMEALACGTPVVAFPSGALADIVEHGVTGFHVRNEQEMADAIEACGRIDPERCKAAARERFPAQAMIHKYFDVYQQLAAKS